MGTKKAHGFVLIHALGGLYSVVREFGSLQKGKNTFFTSAKSLVKISTVETAKPPILSGVSWAISFSLPFDGGDGGIRTHGPLRIKRFRVFYSQHTLADFEKKCPILREKALVRKKIIFSPLRLFPTVRNARELSERTNRTAIKHNNRKSP